MDAEDIARVLLAARVVSGDAEEGGAPALRFEAAPGCAGSAQPPGQVLDETNGDQDQGMAEAVQLGTSDRGHTFKALKKVCASLRQGRYTSDLHRDVKESCNVDALSYMHGRDQALSWTPLTCNVVSGHGGGSRSQKAGSALGAAR